MGHRRDAPLTRVRHGRPPTSRRIHILFALIAILSPCVAPATEAAPGKPTPSEADLQALANAAKAANDAAIAAAPRSPLAERKRGDRLLFVMASSGDALIDTLGRIVVEPHGEPASPSFEGLAMVIQGGRCGYVDGTGAVVIPPAWDQATAFIGGLALVANGIQHHPVPGETFSYQEGGKRGFIDRTGAYAIPLRFEDAQPLSDGVAWVKEGGRWGLIDRTGRYVLKPRFNSFVPPSGFSEGLCPIWMDNGRKGKANVRGNSYVDTTGTVVIPGPFARAGKFSEGRAAVLTGSRVIFIDHAGRTVLDGGFELSNDLGVYGLAQEVGYFSEGLASVVVSGRCGIVDTTGKMVIEPRYEAAAEFHEGLAAVRLEGRTGYIDRAGQMVIVPAFGRADAFERGIARVEVGYGLWGYIRRDGSYIWDPRPAGSR